MRQTPHHLTPPVDESAEDLDWRYGYFTLADQAGWDREWADIRAKGVERRRRRRME